MSCCSIRPLSISLVLPLTGRPLRFGVNKMCVYFWEMLVSVMLAVTVQLIPEQKLAGHFRELNNGAVTRYFPYTNTSYVLLCWVHCFFSCLDISNGWADILFELTANIQYTCHMHINFLQLVTVSQTSLNIGHTSLISIYKLLLCQFWDSQCNSTWIYANLWVSLCIWLAFWFKLSVLMGHLKLNYTTFDVWLTVLIFGLCKLFLWQASQTAVRPSWSSSSCPVTTSRSWLSNQAETSYCSVWKEF